MVLRGGALRERGMEMERGAAAIVTILAWAVGTCQAQRAGQSEELQPLPTCRFGSIMLGTLAGAVFRGHPSAGGWAYLLRAR